MRLKPWSLFFVLLTLPIFGRATTPKVTLTYAQTFDFVCSLQTGYQIDPKWTEELVVRLPEFQSHWQGSGAELLKTTIAIVGKSFKATEFAVSLSVCSFPSMSEPLLINMRYSLASFTSKPLQKDVTTSIIFHELLHRYLQGKIPSDSALRLKYQKEDGTVLSHIHLLALPKAVYLKLNQESVLQAVIAKDQSLPNKAYSRAWDIVNKEEDFRAFIEELRQ